MQGSRRPRSESRVQQEIVLRYLKDWLQMRISGRSWFSKRTESDYVAAYIVVYVDDIMYLGEPSTIADVHAWLGAEQRFLCQLCNRG